MTDTKLPTNHAVELKKARADGLREAAKIIDDNMPPRTNNANSRVRMALNSLSVALVAKADEVEREERRARP